LKIHVFDFVQKYNDEWQVAKRQEVAKAGNSVNSRNRGVKSKREKSGRSYQQIPKGGMDGDLLRK